jgi:transposase InsO family protein
MALMLFCPKGAIFIPCSKLIDSEQTAQLLVDQLFSLFGLADSFLSDRGPEFASRAYLRLLGIDSKLSTTFHPQTDGTTERYNQEIEDYLSIYCINNLTEWIKYLPILEYTHTNR